MAGKSAVTPVTEEVIHTDPMEVMVPVFLPKIPGDDETVFVGLNGKAWLIPRGKRFEVPKPVAEILFQSDEFKAAADEHSATEQQKMHTVFGAP